MRGFMLAAAAICFGFLALLGVVAAVAIGVQYASPSTVNCDDCPGCPQCPVSPFAGGGSDAVCPPGTPGCQPCPDGVCPLPNGSIEVGDPREGSINESALGEPKGSVSGESVSDDAGRTAWSNCPTCPNQRRPVLVRRPATAQQPGPAVRQPVPATTLVSIDAPREGRFQCHRCGEPKVGEQWHELWADDGTPMTCLCRDCWHTLNPGQREAQLRSYFAQKPLSEARMFYINAAIKEFSSR